MIEALVGALVVAVGAAYWLLIHRRRAGNRPPQPKTRVAQPSKAGGRFGSVQIRTRGGACGAARALEGQRFLA